MLSLSLGFSCQTRLTIDEVSADHRRMPLDNLITTREAVLQTFRRDGATLWPALEALDVFTMPQEGREGPHAEGVFFWHDYPMDGAKLSPLWRQVHADVCAKYQRQWRRFAEILRDHATPKRLVLANTQSNLVKFAGDDADFQRRFGLDSAFYSDLIQALEDFGARNFQVLFLDRDAHAFVATRKGIDDPRFSTRFCGALHLPTNVRLAYSVLACGFDGSRIDRICGRYQDGWTVERSAGPTAIVYRDQGAGPEPAGEICETEGGYQFMFPGVAHYVFRAMEDGQDLRFTSPVGGPKPVWRRLV